jgi:hypothetical protein
MLVGAFLELRSLDVFDSFPDASAKADRKESIIIATSGGDCNWLPAEVGAPSPRNVPGRVKPRPWTTYPTASRSACARRRPMATDSADFHRLSRLVTGSLPLTPETLRRASRPSIVADWSALR